MKSDKVKNDKRKNNKAKKAPGRPKEFNDKKLIEIIDKYVERNNDRASLINASKIAKFANEELNTKISHLTFRRSEAASEYIEKLNETYKRLQAEVLASGDEDEDFVVSKFISPIYERLSPEQLIANSKNQKQLEDNIELLNRNNQRICEEYAKVKHKNLVQYQAILDKNKEIESLKKEISKCKKDKEKIEKLRKDLKKEKEKNSNMARKFAIYDEFMNQYHYDSLKEYTLYLDNQIAESETITVKGSIFDEEKYKSGSYKLSDALDRLDDLLSKVEETEESINNSYDIQDYDDTQCSNDIVDLDNENEDTELNSIDSDNETETESTVLQYDDEDIVGLDFSNTVSKFSKFVKKK